jgi:enamine deaminase RidA (YjgF/YER057c/UK114 family)
LHQPTFIEAPSSAHRGCTPSQPRGEVSQRSRPFPKHREHLWPATHQSADAPQAIGTYSQAVRAAAQLLIRQIALDPKSMTLAEVSMLRSSRFRNLSAVAAAAGATLNDAVKVTVFSPTWAIRRVNEAMAQYPATLSRGAGRGRVSPRGALVEIEAIPGV